MHSMVFNGMLRGHMMINQRIYDDLGMGQEQQTLAETKRLCPRATEWGLQSMPNQ